MPKFRVSFDRKPTPIKRTHPYPITTLQYTVTAGFTEGRNGAGDKALRTGLVQALRDPGAEFGDLVLG